MGAEDVVRVAVEALASRSGALWHADRRTGRMPQMAQLIATAADAPYAQAEDLKRPISLLNRHPGCLPGRMPRKQRPHEGAFVPKHAAAVVPDAVRFDEVRVDAEQGTVLLICSQAGKAEQR